MGSPSTSPATLAATTGDDLSPSDVAGHGSRRKGGGTGLRPANSGSRDALREVSKVAAAWAHDIGSMRKVAKQRGHRLACDNDQEECGPGVESHHRTSFWNDHRSQGYFCGDATEHGTGRHRPQPAMRSVIRACPYS